MNRAGAMKAGRLASCASALLWFAGSYTCAYRLKTNQPTAWHRSSSFATRCDEAPSIRRPVQLAGVQRRDGVESEDHETIKARTYQTPADLYYQQHQELPRPREMHAVLRTNSLRENGKGILVIGDVHGCYDELVLLHDKALQENNGVPFRCVILVGDLCNKGPDSSRVVRFLREQPHWFSVRGNHDNGALSAALGDSKQRDKSTYSWVFKDEKNGTLTDDDIVWLSDLPYTIAISKELLGLDSSDPNAESDTLIVHAGIIPDVSICDQTIDTMVTVRKVAGHPWASIWKGPPRIIFGHDAKRGLQRYSGDWAIGLDTGACYGKALTGVILPKRTIVQVAALATHCPIGK